MESVRFRALCISTRDTDKWRVTLVQQEETSPATRSNESQLTVDAEAIVIDEHRNDTERLLLLAIGLTLNHSQEKLRCQTLAVMSRTLCSPVAKSTVISS